MSVLSFELPVWSATIYHSTPGTDQVWMRAFNVAEVGDEFTDQKQAVQNAVSLFMEDGLWVARIYSIEVARLQTFEGGDEGGGN